MYLPRHSGRVSAATEAVGRAALGRSGECVLVVEDDAEVRAYVVETLRDLGYDVLEAEGAQEALQLLQRHNTVNLLLTDVVMPGKWPQARRRGLRAEVIFKSALYDGVFPQRHRASGTSRPWRGVAPKAPNDRTACYRRSQSPRHGRKAP